MMNFNNVLDLIDCSNYNMDIDSNRITLTEPQDETLDQLALLELDYRELI